MRTEEWEAIAFIDESPIVWLELHTGAIYQHEEADMPFAPPAREREEHERLWHRLQNFKWSVRELEWLQRHANGWPAKLERLVRAKLEAARKEAKDAKSTEGRVSV
jgi:hypothetical protein